MVRTLLLYQGINCLSMTNIMYVMISPERLIIKWNAHYKYILYNVP